MCYIKQQMCGGATPYIKIVESKIPLCSRSGMMKRLNIKAKGAAVALHLTGSTVVCHSMKNGQIIMIINKIFSHLTYQITCKVNLHIPPFLIPAVSELHAIVVLHKPTNSFVLETI